MALLLSGCSAGVSCTDTVDVTGRPFVVCADAMDIAICDDPGRFAFFQETPTGLVLVDGVLATCTLEGEVECLNEGVVRCVPQPGDF